MKPPIHTTQTNYNKRLRKANEVKLEEHIAKTIRSHTGSYYVDQDLVARLAEEIAGLMPDGTRLNILYRLTPEQILEIVETHEQKKKQFSATYIMVLTVMITILAIAIILTF